MWAFVITLALNVAIFALTPFPKSREVKPAGLGDFNFPTASRSRSIPVVFGRQEVKSPNVGWYGDLSAVPIKEKVKAGFRSKKVTVGYEYRMGIMLVLSHGTVDRVVKFRFDDKVAWEGSAASTFTVDKRFLFGGKDENGGVYADCVLYSGSPGQEPDPYMEAVIGESLPAYRGTSYLMWKGPTSRAASGYIGNSKQVKPMFLTIERHSNTLGIPGGRHVIGNNMNPMEMYWDSLTNVEWGMGYPTSLLNKQTFLTAADTLYYENFGLSATWDQEMSIEDFISEIERHIDGARRYNPETGLFEVKLIRDDYDPGTVISYDESNILSLENFSRGSWDSTINEVSIKFPDENYNYEESVVTAQDMGNAFIQNKSVTKTSQYSMITTRQLAADVAYRDLRVLSAPMARFTMVVDRSQGLPNVGDVRKVSWSPLGIDAMIVRVMSVDYGSLLDGQIILEVVEDIFSLDEALFSAPTDTEWTAPDTLPQDVVDYVIEETPYATMLDIFEVDDLSRVNLLPSEGLGRVLAKKPTRTSVDMLMYLDSNEEELARDSFCSVLTLLEPMKASEIGSPTIGKAVVVYNDDGNLNGTAFATINGEVIRVSGLSSDGTSIQIERALMDTVPKDHPEDSLIYVWGDGFYIADSGIRENGATIDYRLGTSSFSGVQEFSESVPVSLTYDQRANRPYRPGNLRVNGTLMPSALPGDQTLSVLWSHRDRLQEKYEELYSFHWQSSIGPEEGTTYDIKIYNEDGNLTHDVQGISGTTHDYPDEELDLGAALLPRSGIYTFADGGVSLPTSGLLGHHTMESVLDDSLLDQRSQYNGLIDGATVGVGFLSFDGSNDFVSIPNIRWLGSDADPSSVVIESKGSGILFSTERASTGIGELKVYLDSDGSLRVLVHTLTNSPFFTEYQSLAGIVDPTSTSTLVFVFDRANTTLKVYSGGSLIWEELGYDFVYEVSPTQHDNIDIKRHRNYTYDTEYSEGLVREFAVYDRALSYVEARDISRGVSDSGPLQFRLNSNVEIRLKAVRDGLDSYQEHSISIERYGYGYNYGNFYGGVV